MKKISLLLAICLGILPALVGQGISDYHKRYVKTSLNKLDIFRINNRLWEPSQKLSLLDRTLARIPAKSKNAVKQRLDSITHRVQEAFKNTSALINSNKVLFYYDANYFQTHEILYEWDNFQYEWLYDTKTEFTYNINGMVASFTDYNWNGAGQWILDYKYVFEYDLNGNMILETDYMYSTSTSTWIPEYKYEYSYDASGLLLTSISSIYNESTSAWDYETKVEFIYNSSMDIFCETEFVWQSSSSQWINDFKTEYTYDANNLLTQDMDYDWDANENQWVQISKAEYSYSSNNLVQKINYSFENFQWAPNSKIEYDYDLLNNQILSNEFYYDSYSSTWVNYFREHFDYNTLVPFSDLILPITWWWFGNPTNFLITDIYGENSYSGSWEDDYYDNYYYTPVNVSDVPENNPMTLSVFPNPASDQFVVRWTEGPQEMKLQFFDVNGRVFSDQIISNNVSFNVKPLAPGIYYYQLNDGAKISFRGKISIQ